MKKVMLVDDEILFRETIRDCINWEAEGFIYCGDASDGEVALPMIEQHQPDILITDIMMPFMNGIELSSIVRTQLPDIKIIILSGHSEFEYARSAMRMGIEEYCLKPVSAAELMKLLHEVSRKIDKERESKASIEKLKQLDNERLTLTKDKLFNDLCSGFVTASEAIHLSSALQVNLIARYYAVAMMDIRYAEPNNPPRHGSLRPNEQALIQRCAALQENDFLKFQRSRTEFVCIMKGDSLDQLQRQLAPFKELQQSIADEVSLANLTASVGIGSVQDRLQNVHLSFLDAGEDMHWRRLSVQNRLALWETSAGIMDQSIFLDRSPYIDFLKIGEQPKLKPFIIGFCGAWKEINWKSSPIGYYIMNDLTLEAFRSAKDMYSHIHDPAETLRQFQQQIGKIQSWEEACSYLVSLTEQFWNWRSRIYDKYSHMLNKVKEYMQDNYGKDSLSLQDAAAFVSVSPSHLSKIFSQETGQTFIEYLTQIRIRKAMELLKSTSAKSYEIAYQVGYNDPHYFSSLFKRVTGRTTTDYRKTAVAKAGWEDE